MRSEIAAAASVEPDAARRKAKGAYYTPPELVDLVVERALGPFADSCTPEEFARVRILDPACGSGAFLHGVLRFAARLPWRAASPELHGVDADSEAIRASVEGLRGASCASLRVADWLMDGRPEREWDVVLGNPPWVGTRTLTRGRRRELAGRYATAVGQFDLMALFVERAAASLSARGRSALLVPDRWLLNPDSEALRRHVLEHSALEEVVRLGDGRFAGVTMPSALVVLTRPGVSTTLVVRDGPDGGPRHFSTRRFDAWDGARLPLHLLPEEVDRAEAMSAEGRPLAELVLNGRGVELGRRSRWVRAEAGPNTSPILFGEDVDRYHLGPGRHVVRGVASVRYKSPELYAPGKLLLRKTGHGIRAALDETDRLVSQVVYVLRPRSPAIDPAYLLGVLNSRSLAFLHRARNGEADKVSFPHLRQGDVLALTVPPPRGEEAAAVAGLARARMTGQHDAARLEAEIDRRVAGLYGPR